MIRRFNLDGYSSRRGPALLRASLVVAVAASVALFPSTGAAESGSSEEPTEFRSVELYIEGREPLVLFSGENLDVSEENIQSMARAHVPASVLSGHSLMNGKSMHVPGWIICDRSTYIWLSHLPYRSVVGRMGANCFGHFSWVQLTGSVWIANDDGSNKIMDWEYDSAYGERNRSVDVELLALPRARCANDSVEVWFGRNDVQVTFHSGTIKHFQTRETDSYLINCGA